MEGLNKVQNDCVGSCEHGNEPSSFVRRCEILEWLSNWRLLKDSVPWS
jgi:hypothetical protein